MALRPLARHNPQPFLCLSDSIVFLAMSFARDFCSLFQYTAAQQCYQAGSGGCNTGGNNPENFLVLADSSTCLSNGVSQFFYGLLSLPVYRRTKA
jgi:hypothetical protein